VALDNPLHIGQPHAGAGNVGVAVESLKWFKNARRVLRFESGSIVADKEIRLITTKLNP
jgi:hypothetical protein